jgi:hypothetical protein
MSVELLGYSERGVINAICEDIHHSAEPHSRLVEFLSWFEFPEPKPSLSADAISKALLLVEQGFSDFGDLDLLVLVKLKSGQNLCFLIEAKVSTDTSSWLTVDDRWKEFKDQLAGVADQTSNLFVQLHRKVRLVAKLRAEHDFTTDLLVPKGRKGGNRVVNKACGKLREYLTESGTAWFGAILPDTQSDLVSFARASFGESAVVEALPTWNTERWGLLSWQVVAAKVRGGQWPRTSETLTWNEGQIFREAPPVRSDIQAKRLALHDDRLVYVVECDKHNGRVIPLDVPDTGYFWKTCKVQVADLLAAADQSITNEPNLPRSGATYIWDSRNEMPLLPEDEPVGGLAEGSPVVVLKRPSWVTTRVRLAQGPADADSFLVFTHQLRRDAV